MDFINKIQKSILKVLAHIIKCNVFVCYTSKNEKEAFEIKKLVDKFGGISFMAPYSITGGKDSKRTIISNVDGCDIFLPLISQEASKSPYANQEIGAAILSKTKSKKEIIPVILGKVNPKNLGYLYDIQHYKYNDLSFKKYLRNRISAKYSKFFVVVIIILVFILLSYPK